MSANSIVIEVYDGVYRLTDPTLTAPKILNHCGKTLHAFMDFLYTENPHLDDLKEEQVSALCRERANFPDLTSKNLANIKVKELLAHILRTHSPSKVLEIGSGTTPVSHDSSKVTQYVLSDADQNVVDKNIGNGNTCIKFSSDDTLHYENSYFDMIIAAFVFHFKIHDSQLREIARCLSIDGVIIINVYRRSMMSRIALVEKLKFNRLKTIRIVDSQNICRDNEYWVIGHENSSNVETYQKSINDYLTEVAETNSTS